MLALYHASQALAALQGRSFVIPDDVKRLITCVLVHRIIPKTQSHLRGRTAEEILKEVVDSVAVPVEEKTETAER